jgi:cytochrome c oxidase subunit 3
MRHDPQVFERSPDGGPRQPSFRMSTRQLLIVLLFVSLSVLFTASIVAYVATRLNSPLWRTPYMPGLPWGLFGSTALIAAVSGSMHWALSCVRKNRLEALGRALWLTGTFALAFLVGQTFNWLAMVPAQTAPGPRTLYAFTFYMLTGLHAVHVLGGFVPLGIAIARARRREYSSSRHEGVRLCAQYWDFLGVVWLVLLTTLHVVT